LKPASLVSVRIDNASPRWPTFSSSRAEAATIRDSRQSSQAWTAESKVNAAPTTMTRTVEFMDVVP
jgi:hypothetical protein